MRTRAQRRNTISAWYSTLIIVTGVAVAAVGFWAFGNSRTTLSQVASQQALPDTDLPILIDEDSLKIAILDRIEDSSARPLWTTTRRPYVAPPLPKKVPAKAPDKKEPPKEIPPLEGTLTSVIIAGQVKTVFLQGAQGAIRLEEGMSYNGWQLGKINQDSAEFHFDEEKKVLQLRAFATVDAAPVKTLGQPKE